MKIQRTVYKFLTVYSFLLIGGLFNFAKGQGIPELQTADSLFREQRYTQAYQEYDKILDSGKASAGMLLRMAYIQESLGNIPKTLYLLNVYYKMTSDEEVLSKIGKLAKAEKLRGYEFSDNEFFMGVFRQYRNSIVLALVLISGALFLLLVYSRFRLNQKPVWQGVLLVLMLGGLFYATNLPLTEPRGIVANDYVYIMSGPSAGSAVVDVIRKGHRLKILGKEDVWYRVEWKEKVLYVKSTALKQV